MVRASGLVLAGAAGLASADVQSGTAGMPAAPAILQGAPLSAVPADSGIQFPATGAMPLPGMAVQGLPMDGTVVAGTAGCATCGSFPRVVPGGGACASGECHSTCDIDKWVVHADALALFRTRGRGISLGGTQGAPPGGPIELRNLSDQYGTAPGMRLFVGRTLPKLSNCDIGMEVGYFGSLGFNTRQENFGPPGGGRIVGGALDILNNENGGTGSPGLLFQRNAIRARTDSSLHSLEANGKLDYFMDGSTVLLAGVRFLRLHDNLDINETGFVGGLPINAFRESTIANNMLGGQLGVEFNRAFSQKLTLNYGFKAGAMANVIDANIRQSSNFVSGGGVYARSFDVGKTKATGLLETGIGVTYALRERMNLHAGYQLLWLTNAGTGQRAPIPAFAGSQALDTLSGGPVVYHGIYAGFEWHWGC